MAPLPSLIQSVLMAGLQKSKWPADLLLCMQQRFVTRITWIAVIAPVKFMIVTKIDSVNLPLESLTLWADKGCLNLLVLIWVQLRPPHLGRRHRRHLPHSLQWPLEPLNWHTAIEVNPTGGLEEDLLTSSARCNWLINEGGEWWFYGRIVTPWQSKIMN